MGTLPKANITPITPMASDFGGTSAPPTGDTGPTADQPDGQNWFMKYLQNKATQVQPQGSFQPAPGAGGAAGQNAQAGKAAGGVMQGILGHL